MAVAPIKEIRAITMMTSNDPTNSLARSPGTPDQGRRRIFRESGTRKLHLLIELCQTREDVAVEQKSLTALASTSIRWKTSDFTHDQSNTRTLSLRRDSYDDLDEATLDRLCQEVALLMGESMDMNSVYKCLDTYTATTSMDNSLESFGITSFDNIGTQTLEQGTLSGDIHPVDITDVNSVKPNVSNSGSRLAEYQTNESVKKQVEVMPGVSFPLIGSQDTWNAMIRGHVTMIACPCCAEDLTCVDFCSMVICTDCWVLSPVHPSKRISSAINCQRDPLVSETSSSVGLGVKAHEVREWLTRRKSEDGKNSIEELLVADL